MKIIKALFSIAVFVALYPFLATGWLAGVIWSALEAGFFFGQKYIDDRGKDFATWKHEVEST